MDAYDFEADDLETEEDDYISDLPDERQNHFMNNLINERDASHLEEIKFKKQILKPTEMIFIIFSYYRENLNSIAAKFHCLVRFSMKKIKISCQNSEEDLTKCYNQISSAVDSIKYIELKHKDSIIASPYFAEECKKMNFGLTMFNRTLYAHSDKLTEQVLKKNARDVVIGKRLFRVSLLPQFGKKRQIFSHIRLFTKKAIGYLKSEFEDREVVVEFDFNEKTIHCIGERQINVLACKNTMKNLFESMVTILIKYGSEESENEMGSRVSKASEYSNKISTYPVLVSQLDKRSVCIISKDNILQKLLKKQKFKNFLQINSPKSEIGLFFLRIYHFYEKKAMIDDLCTKRNYDLSTYAGIFHYFKKIFIEEGENETSEEVLHLLADILAGYREAKERFPVPRRYEPRLNQSASQTLQSSGISFYETGEVIEDSQISNAIKRDVLVQKINTVRSELIKYKIVEAEEKQRVIWRRQREQGSEEFVCSEVDARDMKVGDEYYIGKVKRVEDCGKEKKYYLYEGKLKII